MEQKLELILSELAQLRHEMEINAKDIEYLQNKIDMLDDLEIDVSSLRDDVSHTSSKVYDLENTIEYIKDDVNDLMRLG